MKHNAKKKDYQKMMRKYKKELKKILKETGPWEWGHMTDFMITFINWMRDYYKLGYNVWAMEDCDAFPEDANKPTRLQSLNKAIQLYNRWQNVGEDYYKIAYNEKELKHYLRLGFHLVNRTDGIEKQLNTKGWYSLTLYEDRSKNAEECSKAYIQCKHDFFQYLEEHLEEWWD